MVRGWIPMERKRKVQLNIFFRPCHLFALVHSDENSIKSIAQKVLLTCNC